VYLLLQVNIIDVNDQKPAFDRLVYSTPLIAENNEVGVHVVQVRASDKDLNTNAEIQVRTLLGFLSLPTV